MGPVQKSVATLRISGDDLVPTEISSLLGCAPTASAKKGDVIVGKKTGRERVARTGVWSLHTADQEPENLDEQIEDLLSRLTTDLAIWRNLVETYRVDLFCGLFMSSGNEGIQISPGSLIALGQRGIKLGLDIYGPE
jgi:hypothetical protein